MDYLKLQHPDFVKEALKTKVLHLKPADFIATKYKEELRYLFRLFYFPNFDFTSLPSRIDVSRINQNIDKLKSMSQKNFDLVYNYPFPGGGGFGPGEVLLYLLTNDTHLGGSRSAGADLIQSSKKYEIKSARLSTGGYVSNFKTGSNVKDEAEMIVGLVELGKKYKISGISSNSIGVNMIKDLKRKAGSEYTEIERQYALTAANYFSNDTIFVYNKESSNKGKIITITKPKVDDISIQLVTESRIKPIIKV